MRLCTSFILGVCILLFFTPLFSSQQCRNLLDFPALATHLQNHDLNWDSSKIKVHYGDVNRYTLFRRLGKGSFAEGYLGYDLTEGKQCVVKVYHNENDFDRIFRELIILNLLCNQGKDTKIASSSHVIQPQNSDPSPTSRALSSLSALFSPRSSLSSFSATEASPQALGTKKRRIVREEILTMAESFQEKETFNSEEELFFYDFVLEEDIPGEGKIKRVYYEESDDLWMALKDLSKANQEHLGTDKQSLMSLFKQSALNFLSLGGLDSLWVTLSDSLSSWLPLSKITSSIGMRKAESLRKIDPQEASASIDSRSLLPATVTVTEDKSSSGSYYSRLFDPEGHNNYIVKLYDITHDTYEETPALVFEYVNSAYEQPDGFVPADTPSAPPTAIDVSPSAPSPVASDSLLILESNLRKKIVQSFEDLSFNFSPEELRFYFRQLFYGLAQIHKQNVIHRDLKPDNIIINPVEKYAKIIDFSLSRFYYPGISLSIAGTTTYMAPEILMKFKQYGPTCDVWSLGVILLRIIFQDQYLLSSNNSFRQLENIVGLLGSKAVIDYRQEYSITYRESSSIFSPDKVTSYPKKDLTTLIKTDRSRELASKDAIDFLQRVLVYDHTKRLTAEQCLDHPFLQL